MEREGGGRRRREVRRECIVVVVCWWVDGGWVGALMVWSSSVRLVQARFSLGDIEWTRETPASTLKVHVYVKAEFSIIGNDSGCSIGSDSDVRSSKILRDHEIPEPDRIIISQHVSGLLAVFMLRLKVFITNSSRLDFSDHCHIQSSLMHPIP